MHRQHLSVIHLACLLAAATNIACVTTVNGIATVGSVGLNGNRINSNGDDIFAPKTPAQASTPSPASASPGPLSPPPGVIGSPSPRPPSPETASPSPSMPCCPTPRTTPSPSGTPSSGASEPCLGETVDFGDKFPGRINAMTHGPNGNIYTAGADHIYRIDSTGAVAVLAGSRFAGTADGTGEAARFTFINMLYYHGKTNTLYVGDNHKLRKSTLEGVVTTPTDYGSEPFNLTWLVNYGVYSSPIWAMKGVEEILMPAPSGNKLVKHVLGKTPPGTGLYVLSQAPNAGGVENHGFLTTVMAGSDEAGDQDGYAMSARFNGIADIVSDDVDVYVADMKNHKIKRVDAAGNVKTVAGDGTPGHADGPNGTSKLSNPTDLALGPDGTVYVLDSGNSMIRVLARDGRLSTLGTVSTTLGTKPIALGIGQMVVTAAGHVLFPDGDHLRRFIPSVTPCKEPVTSMSQATN